VADIDFGSTLIERLDWRLAQETNAKSWRRLNGDGTSKVLARGK
jgi:hypothetical protein